MLSLLLMFMQAQPNQTQAAIAKLPVGSAPNPVPIPHFPDRLHAFVWRNWELVSPDRMATTVHATPKQITDLGHSMGLNGPPRVTRDLIRRSYITVIRRNWHLLPYDQLLTLLDWTPEKLAFTLREDDFLYVKLGNLKPKCDPLLYSPPDSKAVEREKQIAEIVHKEFLDGVGIPREPRFEFVKKLSASPGKMVKAAIASKLSPRFCYSYFALYGDPLLETDCDPYPDGYLERLAASGVDGVWLQAVLYKLTPFPWYAAAGSTSAGYLSISAGYDKRLENLRKLCLRAKRHGIRVFLYLNEPRAMPLAFYSDNPELKGVVEGDHAALCTSVESVQAYLVDSVKSICTAVPELGGFFTISGSENLSNCWSHGRGADCPRCRERRPEDVIAEYHSLIKRGIDEAGSKAKLIAWDWGWNDAWIPGIVERLPAGIAVQSVSEWSIPIKRGGIDSVIGEYSLSTIGPGRRATRTWELAHKRGLKALAKIQAGNSWELSAVPYIPAVENAAQHAANLRKAGVDGIQLGWTLGGYPSPNLEAVAEVSAGASVDEALQRVAKRRFGNELAPKMVTAWKAASAAFREFPFHPGTVYSAPLQMGPANLLYEKPTGYAATMVGIPYDDLKAWREVYPADVFAAQLEKVARGIISAYASLPRKRPEAQRGGQLRSEINVAIAAAYHFLSVAQQSRFVQARDRLLASHSEAERHSERDTLRALVREEITLAEFMYVVASEDSRLGFEATNQYYYTPLDLVEKVINCRDLLDRWLKD